MVIWDPRQYLKFAGERTQAAIDLLARIALDRPSRVVDLGCGPGNSTALLAARWPDADLAGLDSSPEMLAEAQAVLPALRFTQGDVATWTSATPLDVIFCNAVLQWVPGYGARLPHLMAQLNPGGVFAAQVPDNFDEPTHALMRRVAAEGPWAAQLAGVRTDRPVLSPAEVYDALVPHARAVTVWRTIYFHVLADAHGILEFVRGTGLRPFLQALDPADRPAFDAQYLAALEAAYPRRADGKVLLPFPRLFWIAER